jgi:hypothetical protein
MIFSGTLKRLGWLVLLVACGSTTEPQREMSTPVSGSEPNLVVQDLGAIRRPDGKKVLTGSQLTAKDLATFLPAMGDLSPAELAVLLDAVNLTTAACEPCMQDGTSLGSCALRNLSSCANLPTLLQRAFRAAIQGGDLSEVQQAVSFVEPWQDVSALTGDSAAPVRVVFAVDYLDLFSQRAWAPWADLKKEYKEAISFHLLHVPSPRHAGAEKIATDVIRGAHAPPFGPTLGKSQPGLNLKAHQEIAARLHVDATPVVWINGYRVSGQRKVGLLQLFVDLGLADGQNEER